MAAPKHLDIRLVRGIHNCGASYNKISKHFNISKSTISYHLSNGGKERLKKYRIKKFKDDANFIVGKKVDKFKEKSHKPTSAFYLTRGKKNKFTSVGKVIYSKIRTFKGKTNPRKMKAYKQGNISKPYSTKDVIKHIGGIDNAKCYLTGKKLNLHDSYSWQLDHIIPRTKGGSNDLDNMGATTREVNMSKNAMTLEEYHQLCKDVLEHAGYSVIPPKN